MMDQLQLIHQISHRLDLFRSVNGSKQFRFRCNICGDSQKSATKSRGFFIYTPETDSYYFKCHNCGVSMSLMNYCKHYFLDEFTKFRFDTFLDSNKKPTVSTITEKIKPVAIDTVSTLLPITSNTHALQYIESRKIPTSKWHRILYTENLRSTVRELDVNNVYLEKNPPEEPRIILPIHDSSGNIIGIQGRAIPGITNTSSNQRYLTYMFIEGDKLFGISNVDWNKDVIVTEGAIDSLFLSNAIAINGGSSSVLETFDKSKLIIAFDNEPHNNHTVNILKKMIKRGYRVVDWSKIPPIYKDINDMILHGNYTPEYIEQYIMTNNYTGLQAQLKLANRG